MMPITTNRYNRSQFRILLAKAGLFEALRFINSQSLHRFTALYIFDGPILRNVCLVDREDGLVRRMESIEVTDSYCLYVRNSGQTFVTPHSLADSRVVGHPKREAIQSYCGLPLMNADSVMIGTICHFDFDPVPFPDEEVRLLELIAPSLIDVLRQSDAV